MAPGGAASRLIQRAQAQGQVRVIVMLRIVMRMEHTLSGPDVVRQRQALRSVQDGLATRVLGSPSDPDVVRFDFIPAMSLFVNAAELRRLLADPAVVSVQEDIPMAPELNESIPQIHADDVFAKGFNGTGYAVAIVDTGVDKTHPMFAGGKVVRESCYSTNNAASGISSFCPGGAASSIAAGSGVNCPTNVNGCEHGTHVASIAAGNSNVYDGVARDAKVIAIQVFSRRANCAPNPSPCSRTFQTDQISGLQRVYNLRNLHTIAAVNMSFGGALRAAACDAEVPAYTTALNNLLAAGIAPIKSAGNNGSNTSVTFPGCITSAIVVGNATGTDLANAGSNISPIVDLMAPGTQINAAVPGGGHEALTGTSMAAPHVTGSFALLKNVKPTATVADILAALKCSGKPVDKRAVAGSPEISPVLPRIDLIGAFNFIKKPAGATRSWVFSTLDDAKDWQPFRGVWTTSGGFYRPTLQPIWVNTSVANCDTKLDVTVRMRRVDPTPPDPTDPRFTSVWNSGVWVKTTLDHGAETISGYFFAFNKAWWCAVTPPANQKCPAAQLKQGQGAIYRLTNSNAETGAVTGGVKLCFKNLPIVVGGFNKLRIVSNGARQVLYLNDKLVCTVDDATYVAGPVVLAAATPCASGSPPACAPKAGHLLQVDSVSIKSLETAAAPSPGAELMDPMAFAAAPTAVASGAHSVGQPAGVTASR